MTGLPISNMVCHPGGHNKIVNKFYIWVRSRNCGCLVTWFCYLSIANPGNKTAKVSWPDSYLVKWSHCNSFEDHDPKKRYPAISVNSSKIWSNCCHSTYPPSYLKLLFVLLGEAGVHLDLWGCEGGAGDELQVGVAHQFTGQPQEGLLKVVVTLCTDVVVLQYQSREEIEITCTAKKFLCPRD